jgi:hypothetical protein
VTNDDRFVTQLTLLWGVVGLYLALRVIRGIMRRVIRGRKAKTEIATLKTVAASVKWLVNPRSWAPTRRSAEENLPEYSARLMKTPERLE